MKKVTKDKRKERINMLKEIHIHLNYKLEDYDKWTIEDNFIDTKMVINNAIQSPYNEVIHTTQPHFLSFKYFPARLFVHLYNKNDEEEVHEITLEHCEGTEKELRPAHNLERMLLAGSFDWFNPNEGK